jgi:transposase
MSHVPAAHRGPTRARRSVSTLERICPDAAGIDCGASEHYVAVPPDRDAQPVQRFGPFTHELERLVAWLQAGGVTTVAMEATGVYWIPLYELLEERGLTVCLVNAHHVKNVAGRKSDVSDCEWLRDLLMVGLLRGSFRPPAAIVALRSYVRHRDTLIQQAGRYLQRMQKALLEMNVQLPRVVSDIGGVTGLRIIRDIVAGQRDPATLAAHRDPRCRASVADIVAALTGHYREEHIFVLQQHLHLFDVVTAQLAACDQVIEQHLQRLTTPLPPPVPPLPAPRVTRKPKGNEPSFDVRTPLHQLAGADLSQIDGLGPYSALRLISEIGTDMTRWRTEKHFTAWLTLAPHNRISGGRLLSSRTRPSANRAAAILRMAAMALGYTSTALGAFYRRLALRAGKARAITATARKLAILVYHTLKDGVVYVDPGAAAYDAQHQSRLLRRLQRQAQHLGWALVSQTTGEVYQNEVS